MSKIDRLVGVKVFGWELRLDKDGAEVWYTKRANAFEKQYDCSPIVHGPNFTTEIAAAMEVWGNPHVVRHVEYLAPSVDEDKGTVLHWVSAVNINGVRRGCTSVNPAMALCEAALQAVGVSWSEIQEAMR